MASASSCYIPYWYITCRLVMNFMMSAFIDQNILNTYMFKAFDNTVHRNIYDDLCSPIFIAYIVHITLGVGYIHKYFVLLYTYIILVHTCEKVL